MVPIPALINIYMANQYAPDPTMSEKDKDVHPECLALGNIPNGQYFKHDRGQRPLRTQIQRTEVFF